VEDDRATQPAALRSAHGHSPSGRGWSSSAVTKVRASPDPPRPHKPRLRNCSGPGEDGDDLCCSSRATSPGHRRGVVPSPAGRRRHHRVGRLRRNQGAPGTDNTPVLELISTGRRHRPVCWTANCCASAPPQEKPSTSTRWWPSSSSIRVSIQASCGNPWGSRWWCGPRSA